MKEILKFVVLLFLLTGSSFAATDGLRAYESRHNARIRQYQTGALSVLDRSTSGGPYLNSSSFGDTKLNTDSEAETFMQQYADVAALPDGKFVVAWEDDRNGEFDIYVQIYSAANEPVGGNVRLIYDSNFGDQRMPSIDADASGNIVVAWIDSDGSLYGRVFDENLTAVTDKFKVNDDGGTNVCNLPHVAFIYGGGLAFVWEDSRNGENIYCQLYTPVFETLGGNFKINTSAANSHYWAPDIASGEGEGFAVSWEEITDFGSTVVMRTYTTGGVPISGLISLPDPAHGSDDQFQSAVCHLNGIGYMAFWIDTRDGNQLVYSQKVSYAGNKSGVNQPVSDNPDNQCWDVACAKSGNDEILVVWTSYGVRAEVLGSRFDAFGDRLGVNISLSDPGALRDRFYPRTAIGADNLPVVVWTDVRSGETDTYFQRMDNAGNLSGANVSLAVIEAGAQQTMPDVAVIDGTNFAAVWKDLRTDLGDIYIQFGNIAGVPLGINQKVNQDSHPFLQTDPAIGSDGGLYATVAWVDSREESGSASGLMVYSRRYGASGLPLFDELLTSNDPMGSTKAAPDAAQSSTGRAAVVWEDWRDGQSDIYCQKVALSGALDGDNFKVNTAPELTANFSPKVGISSSNVIVIAWRSEVNGLYRIYYQLVGADGAPVGINTPVSTAKPTDSQVDFDMAVDAAGGSFVVAWINGSDTGEFDILAQRYTSLGVPVGDIIPIASALIDPSNISAAIDAAGNFSVCWTESRSGHKSVYMVVVSADDLVGSEMLMSSAGSSALSDHGALAMTGQDAYAVWNDNRDLGHGFDVFVNSYNYSPTAADDIDEVIVPESYVLSQNYPNPFNPRTTIRFYLSRSGAVSVEVHNLLGQLVLKRSWDHLPAGWHEYEFNGGNAPSGVYFYRLTSGDFSATKKMMLVK